LGGDRRAGGEEAEEEDATQHGRDYSIRCKSVGPSYRLNIGEVPENSTQTARTPYAWRHSGFA